MEASQRVQCVDIGNTRTHIGIYENGKIYEQTHISTIDLVNSKKIFAIVSSEFPPLLDPRPPN